MAKYPIFLSVVLCVKNQSSALCEMIAAVAKLVSACVDDYEIVIVDNASTDDSILTLKECTSDQGLPNLQVYALTKAVDSDTASWVGVENALGDYVLIIDPLLDSVNFLPKMLEELKNGADVIFATNLKKPMESFSYRMARRVFNVLYRFFNGINPESEAPQFRILSKKVINFILQHPQPALTFRHLPATGGFAQVKLKYAELPSKAHSKCLTDSVDRGVRMLVSTTNAPMRLVTSLSLFGAIFSLIYTAYILMVAVLKSDVAPGWISLSLQISCMFFLISLVLFVLGEYILHMAKLTNEGPLYHVAQEFTSARMDSRNKLNISE